MKHWITLLFIAAMAVTIASCGKRNDQPTPVTPTQSDTSKNLIGNTTLVGDWNIVADTIINGGQVYPYQGIPGDHYHFTKYGNLFINSGFHAFVDTAIYGISVDSKAVQWVNSYISVDGQSSRTPSTAGVFEIKSVSDHSLFLSQDFTGANGILRQERIWFSK